VADDGVRPTGAGRHASPPRAADDGGTRPVPSGGLTLPSLQPLVPTPDTDDMPGIQAVVQGQRLQQQLAESQVSDVVVNLQQAATYSSEIKDHLADAADALQKAHRAVPEIARQAVEAAADEARSQAQQARYDAQGYLSDPNYRSATQRPRNEATSPQTTPLGPMTYQEGRSVGGSIRQIGQQASARTAQWMSEHQPYVGEHLPEGEGTGAASVFSRVAGGLRNVGEGEGLAGGLSGAGLSGATKLLGPIGIAVGAATAGVNFMESQRAANLPYQQAYGTSNSAGYAQRAQEWLHGLSGIGNMGIGAAREQFQAVSQLGIQGDARGQALDFMQDLYMRYGMQTADSIALVETAVNSGTVSLTSLTDAIDSVSTTAADAHVNVAQAQKDFAALLQTVTATGTTGAAAAPLAASLQNVSTELGRGIAAGTDISGILSQTNVYAAAGVAGMDPTAFQQRVFGQRPGAIRRVVNFAVDRFLTNIIPDPGVQDALRQWITDNIADPANPTGPQALAFFNYASRTYPGQVQLNTQAVIASAQAVGITQVPPTGATGLVIMALAGVITPDLSGLPGAGAAGAQPGAGPGAGGAGARLSSDPSLFSSPLGSSGATPDPTLSGQRGQFLSDLGYSSTTGVDIIPRPTAGRGGALTALTGQQEDVNAYYQYVQQHGPNPVLAALLSKANYSESAGATFDIQVNGQWVRGKTLDEIMQNPEWAKALVSPSATETLASGQTTTPYSELAGLGGGGGTAGGGGGSGGGGGLGDLLGAPQTIARNAMSAVQGAIRQARQDKIDVTVHVTDDRIRPSDVTVTQRSGTPNSRSAVPGEAYDPNSRRPRGATR
jgi:hypothetical protein